MKVIEAGKQLVVGERWWIGMRVTCPECGCVFELDATDSAVFATDHSFGVNCPNYMGNCRTHLTIRRDGILESANSINSKSELV